MKLIEKSDPANGKFYHIYMPTRSAKKTTYFLGSYEGRLAYFWIFIKLMTLKGYRVVYLQPCKEVLSHHHPTWLGDSINQAVDIIKKDMKKFPTDTSALVGVSLGSYLNLNIFLQVKFKKCVVVAGGAPLVGVFKTKFLFKKARKELHKNGKELESVTEYWQPFDEAFKTINLSHMEVLLINSNNDRLLEPKNFYWFIKLLRRTGAIVVNRQKGHLPHVLQALSINWRVKEISRFLKS